MRLPSADEQRRTELNLDSHLAEYEKERVADGRPHAPAPPPEIATYFASSPLLRHEQYAFVGMKLAWGLEIRANGRDWIVTPEMYLIPRDKVRVTDPVGSASFDLKDASAPTMPFALTLEVTPQLEQQGNQLLEIGNWQRRELVILDDGGMWFGGQRFESSVDGPFMRRSAIAKFSERRRPSDIDADEKWIAISVYSGSLIAYEGDKPVFAAAMSPGMHGADPTARYATIPGRFAVSSKHLTSTMGGQVGQASWRTREVPWVAYYDGSYAIHGAYWHDSFGRPRSHGCINLTPADAKRLFAWMDPQLPPGWYAVKMHKQHAPSTKIIIER